MKVKSGENEKSGVKFRPNLVRGPMIESEGLCFQ